MRTTFTASRLRCGMPLSDTSPIASTCPGLPKAPTTYLKKMYFDTTVFTREQLAYLVGNYGADHIMLGTDYPYDMAEYYPIEHIVTTAALSNDQKAAVAGGTAVGLFGLKR